LNKNDRKPELERLHYVYVNTISILFCFLVIATSILLEPSSKGYGTHKSLGLPSCLICRVLSLENCPSCGLTTGFCLIGKGKFHEAVSAHPWSPVFFILLLIILIISIISLVRKNLKYWFISLFLTSVICILYSVYWFSAIFKML
jgi:uncharacterized protein DUF2752